MLDTSSNPSHVKSFIIFAVILVVAVAVVITTQKSSSLSDVGDIRMRAANEADLMVDSDAVMATGDMEVSTLGSDPDFQDNEVDEAAEEAELAELNAL